MPFGRPRRPRGGTRAPAKSRSGAAELVRTIVGALLIFLVIRTFFLEAFRIPSGSMEPTLLVGDFLFVNKLVFGPVLPFTNVRLPGYGEPARRDLAVYTSPYQFDQPWDPTPTVVKRIVGAAGDTLFMRDGMLHVNGIQQREGFAAAQRPVGWQDHTDQNFMWQNRYVIRGSRFGAPPDVPSHDNWGPFVVPLGHLFMLGDNRYESKDARYYGFVPRGNLRCRPSFIYFSIDTDAWRLRWRRIGDVIR